MALMKLLYVFPTCLLSFPIELDSPSLFFFNITTDIQGEINELTTVTAQGGNSEKGQLQQAILWTDPIHLEIRALEEERGRKIMCMAMSLYVLCIAGGEGEICVQKRKLCSGTKGQTYLGAYDENQKEIFH